MVELSYNFCNGGLANQQLFVLQMAVEGQEAVILTITLSSGLYHELSMCFCMVLIRVTVGVGAIRNSCDTWLGKVPFSFTICTCLPLGRAERRYPGSPMLIVCLLLVQT